MYKDSFTTEQWRTLQFAPFWVLGAIGTSDGRPDRKEFEKEFAALAKEIAEASLYKDTLVKEVLQSVGDDLAAIVPAFAADTRDVLHGLRDVATVLDGAGEEHAAAFKRVMLIIGMKIAEATGSGFHRHKASKKEEQALVLVGASIML